MHFIYKGIHFLLAVAPLLSAVQGNPIDQGSVKRRDINGHIDSYSNAIPRAVSERENSIAADDEWNEFKSIQRVKERDVEDDDVSNPIIESRALPETTREKIQRLTNKAAELLHLKKPEKTRMFETMATDVRQWITQVVPGRANSEQIVEQYRQHWYRYRNNALDDKPKVPIRIVDKYGKKIKAALDEKEEQIRKAKTVGHGHKSPQG